MKREVCGGCHSTNLTEVLNLGDSPLADDFPTEPEAGQKTYPLGLARCRFCTLVQLTEIVPDEELWGGDYGFYTGSSWVAVEQQRRYAELVMATHEPQCQSGVVEIACNDGSMLKRFQEAGYHTVGVDPARGPASKAIESGLDVWIEGFSLSVATRMVAQYGRAGLVVANNVVAHVADLDDFVHGLSVLLHPAGVAYLEFQYVADLVTGNMIDHVYHEHRQFFSLTSLNRVLGRWGLMAYTVEQTTPQGGSLRVRVAHKLRITNGPGPSVRRLLASEAWLNDEHALDGFQGRAERIRDRLLGILHGLSRDHALVAGYGASAKSTTLLNFCGIGPDLVQYVVDTTPMKHGRYTPGTGIPIIDPTADSRAPDVYLMMIHNYLSQVMRRETTFGGKWLVPIPLPVLL